MTLLLLDTIFWNRKLVKSKMEAPLNHTWKPFTEQPQRTVHPQWLSLRAHVHMKKSLLQDVKKGTLVQEQLFPGLHSSALLCVIIFWEPGICLSGRQECCDNVVTKTTINQRTFTSSVWKFYWWQAPHNCLFCTSQKCQVKWNEFIFGAANKELKWSYRSTYNELLDIWNTQDITHQSIQNGKLDIDCGS